MTSTPVTHTSTPLAPAGTEATPSQYVVMPSERPQGIAPLYVPHTLHASKKCLFPCPQWKSLGRVARPPLSVRPNAAAHGLPVSPLGRWIDPWGRLPTLSRLTSLPAVGRSQLTSHLSICHLSCSPCPSFTPFVPNSAPLSASPSHSSSPKSVG